MHGNLQEFQPDSESISAYLERTSAYFIANSIGADKQVAVLLSVIGAKNYSLLRSLTAPTMPKDMSYGDLSAVLMAHFEPKPLLIAERFHFYQRKQAEGETTAQFVAELRRLATHCEFDERLDDALRDRLVCGLRNESVQKRLLSEAGLTFKRALELALGMESADANAKAIKHQGDDTSIKRLSHTPRKSEAVTGTAPKREPCYRCGRSNHTPQNCRFINAKCHICNKIGHIAPVCRSSQRSGAKRQDRQGRKRQPHKTKYVAESAEDEESGGSDEFQLFTLETKSSQPITVDLQVEGKPLTMEVDTGAAVAIISEHTRKEILPQTKPHASKIILKTYTDERMPVVGELTVEVSYGQQCKKLPLIVVEGEGPSLLGRNWLKDIRLDWTTIARVGREESLDIDTLLDTHKELFNEELGKIRSYQAKLQVRRDAIPKFFKHRPVPFSIKEAIENELDRLETLGAIEKVDHSEWASPIVPVPKKDGKVRVCGDYKMTINPVLEVDQYPLPKPQDLFATLAGGKKIYKARLVSSIPTTHP